MKFATTIAEARERLARVGYSLRKKDGEFEVFPKGKPGPLSYFTNDLDDAVGTARAEVERAFKAKVDPLPIPTEAKTALCMWHRSHGVEWKEELYHAWITGNYGTFAHDNVSSTLQRLRNSPNGHEVIENL
jgi:hypothetical protein